jgi:hypothetical protein
LFEVLHELLFAAIITCGVVDVFVEKCMDVYKNPNCRKIKGSHLLEVSCAYCKFFIAKYQKVGESNFVKMYNDRIIEGTIDFSKYQGALYCPKCKKQIATRYITKMDKKEAYRFVPSAFNKKKVY